MNPLAGAFAAGTVLGFAVASALAARADTDLDDPDDPRGPETASERLTACPECDGQGDDDCWRCDGRGEIPFNPDDDFPDGFGLE